jgi:hypothetical protein
MKILAHYLPQYHRIPENDLWWGKGYTEWTALLKSRPLFKGHYQPRVPLHHNYYDLSDIRVLEWQAELAQAYGINGFCLWHYWFGGKLLLERPAAMMRQHNLPDILYCFSWANEPWTRSWYGQHNTVLMDQKYGDKNDWKQHYEYVSMFFKDHRYIKIDDRPIFLILNTAHIGPCNAMMDYWRELAVKDGFRGIYFVKILSRYPLDARDLDVDAKLFFEPGYTLIHEMPLMWRMKRRGTAFTRRLMNRSLLPFNAVENIIDYTEVCEHIIARTLSRNLQTIPGIFTDWDNTPRRMYSSTVYAGSNPESFEHYLRALIDTCRSTYASDFLFINAWNEWAEGAYLEPDERYQYGYLEAVKRSLECRADAHALGSGTPTAAAIDREQ